MRDTDRDRLSTGTQLCSVVARLPLPLDGQPDGVSTRNPVLAQLYVSAAVLGFAASFAPLYTPRKPGDVYETLTMWSAIPDYDSTVGVLAVCLVLGMVALALLAARRWSPGVALAVVVVAIVGALMLLLRVGEGSNPPSFGTGAGLLFGACLALIGTASVDLWAFLGAKPVGPHAV